jgi:hypothetical protein
LRAPGLVKSAARLGLISAPWAESCSKTGFCAIDVVGDSATKPTIKQNNFRRSLLIGVRVLTLRGQAAISAACRTWLRSLVDQVSCSRCNQSFAHFSKLLMFRLISIATTRPLCWCCCDWFAIAPIWRGRQKSGWFSAPPAKQGYIASRYSHFVNTIRQEETLGALMIERPAAKISPVMCKL